MNEAKRYLIVELEKLNRRSNFLIGLGAFGYTFVSYAAYRNLFMEENPNFISYVLGMANLVLTLPLAYDFGVVVNCKKDTARKLNELKNSTETPTTTKHI